MMWDAVVLGVGGVGSFALRAVARDIVKGKGGAVLGIERFARGHDKGSSHGKSRVYRKAYFEHPSYVPWCQYSEQEFKNLERSQGVSLLEECGVLVVAPKAHRQWLDACLESARQHGIPTETFDAAADMQQRFPQYRYNPAADMMGVYEPGGGMVRPERTIDAALTEATSLGATLWEHCRVTSIAENDGEDCVTIHVEKADKEKVVVKAKKVLIGAGGWTSELVPEWAPHLKPIRILQTWVDVSKADGREDGIPDPSLYDVANMPCTVMVNPTELDIPVYCLPADRNADGDDDVYKSSVKLGVHGDVGGHGRIDPDHNSTMAVSPEEQAKMDAAIRATFPAQVSSQPVVETKPCMYTMTDDEHFMIGVPKGYRNVCAVAGLSGHGFKMTPALGQMLADFATGKGLDRWKADFCSPRRFGV